MFFLFFLFGLFFLFCKFSCILFFFFSSRRRHTRLTCDWSSDVCSSDLQGVGGIAATFRDITERKAFEDQLSHMALHDALTGLPNRALFLDRLTQAGLRDRKSTRLNSSHMSISYAVFCLKKKNYTL